VFRLPSIRLGRVLGIPVEVNVTWFLVFGLVSWSLAGDYYPLEFPGRSTSIDIVSGILTALMFFTSLVAHELCHSLVARRSGIPVERITLFLFGGVAQLAEEPRSAGAELRMALAGPAASLVMALGWYGLFRGANSYGLASVYWAPLLTLAMVNAVIVGFNLMPGFPMDGGRVLRSLLWWATGDRALSTRIASLVGRVLGVGIAAVGIWLAVTGILSGLWLAFLGTFLSVLATRAYTSQLQRFRVAATPVTDVMAPHVPTFDESVSLADAARHLRSMPGPKVVAVVAGDRFVGVLRADEAERVLAADPSATVGEAAVVPDRADLVDARESLETAVRRLQIADPGELLVVCDGRLAGWITPQRVDAVLLAAAPPRV
jgi:Zn-dependent protease